jgi:phytoene dehydrogenase-like protein
VTVLEAAPRVGGAAVTREFAPGFKVSACAHLLYGLNPRIAKDLALDAHGLRLARSGLRTVALSPDGSPLVIEPGSSTLAPDQAALSEFTRRMRRFASLLARQHLRPPPRLAWDTWGEAMQAAQLALDIRRLGREDMREFLRVATMNIFDVLEDTFENPLLKGALAMDAVLGTRLGPRSGHTVLNLLHRWSGAASNARAGWSARVVWNASASGIEGAAPYDAGALPRGGMGTVTHAMAAAALAAGAEIRVSSPVAAILLQQDRAAGVRLASGEEITAGIVVSNADPKHTFLQLLGARHLETEFARRVHTLRAKGTAAKVNLALSAQPTFKGLDGAHAGERLLIAPDLESIETAFNPAKYGSYSERPVLEITVPSIHDDTLAPPEQHVLSAIVQYAPYDIEGGWDAHREAFFARVLAVLEEYAPGLRSTIVGAELLTPFDIEREFRITGGHWHHGELTLDQYLMLRPTPGAAQYGTPIRNLYLCGAGCHPGGGVMGASGHNAAQAILGGAHEA